MIRELKPLLWFVVIAATVVAIVWRIPDILLAMK